ncbi:MAG: ABC transporter ATP-binding protein [Alphaproteobacteria bacterium]|nr:MAG: ABC transporter ATP-binding protein [Alphaproteobacteria bacterium]
MFYALRDVAGEALRPIPRPRLRPGEFWAVDDLSFQLGAGEALGILGGNGAGKSTLLKMLYGLIKPDRGEIRIRGRAEALIELGAGFNPALTGRETVDVAAAVNGLGRAETARLLERVEDFAELGEIIGAPMLSYSSGMRARLAFALAIGLEPDLLLIDEALAVGDPYFQRKCMNMMHRFLHDGGSILFVSHNPHQVQALCSRAILLESGRLAFEGSAVETVSHMLDQQGGGGWGSDDEGDGPLVIERLSIAGDGGGSIGSGEAARLTLRYRSAETTDIRWGFNIMTRDQAICVTGGSDMAPMRIEAGEGELSCVVPNLSLVPGLYMLRAAVHEASSNVRLAGCGWTRPGLIFKVEAAPGLLTNAQMQIGQLVVTDVDWGRR